MFSYTIPSQSSVGNTSWCIYRFVTPDNVLLTTGSRHWYCRSQIYHRKTAKNICFLCPGEMAGYVWSRSVEEDIGSLECEACKTEYFWCSMYLGETFSLTVTVTGYEKVSSCMCWLWFKYFVTAAQTFFIKKNLPFSSQIHTCVTNCWVLILDFCLICLSLTFPQLLIQFHIIKTKV